MKSGIIAMALGAILMGQGCRMAWISSGASSHPVAVELGELERSGKLPDSHLAIGAHLALFGASVAGDDGGREFDFVLYPIVSLGPEGRLPTQEFEVESKKRSVRIVVKSYDGLPYPSFENEEMARGAAKVESVTGLITGAGKDLDYRARNLLKKKLDRKSVDDLVVLEQGKRPSTLWGLLTIVGGLIIFLFGGYNAARAMADAAD